MRFGKGFLRGGADDFGACCGRMLHAVCEFSRWVMRVKCCLGDMTLTPAGEVSWTRALPKWFLICQRLKGGPGTMTKVVAGGTRGRKGNTSGITGAG